VPTVERCREATGAEVACAAGGVSSARLVSNEPLMPGQHYEAILAAPAAPPIADAAGNRLAPLTRNLRGWQYPEQDSPRGDL